jgi:hypothetical protein
MCLRTVNPFFQVKHMWLRMDCTWRCAQTAGYNSEQTSLVACLFRSVAKVYGQSAVGVLLTGMGKDGASELKLMKEQGAVTIVQDRDTAVVHGMPGEVIRLGGATYVLPPEKICLALASLTTRTVGNEGRATPNRQDGASEIAGPFLGLDLSGS